LPLLTPEYVGGLSVFARRFFEVLFEALPPGAVIVFDNTQEVGEEATWHGVLAGALNAVPSGPSIIFISRQLPPPAFSATISRGLLVGPEGIVSARLSARATRRPRRGGEPFRRLLLPAAVADRRPPADVRPGGPPRGGGCHGSLRSGYAAPAVSASNPSSACSQVGSRGGARGSGRHASPDYRGCGAPPRSRTKNRFAVRPRSCERVSSRDEAARRRGCPAIQRCAAAFSGRSGRVTSYKP
jgi:hypothetical protein